MNRKFQKIISVVSAAAVCVSPAINSEVIIQNSVIASGGYSMEKLDRGIYAVKSSQGMFVSWRFNADDASDAEFRLYRDDDLIYTSSKGDPSCFLDKSGNPYSSYRVDTYENGSLKSSDKCKLSSQNSYFDIPLNKPSGSCSYSANDCSFGDVDGDGQYEIFLKWDPENAKDNSQEGYTDNVYIDCYTLEGKMLWRVDLGKNIRAGQHYTQFLVADFDGDGKAEMTCKTADGTKDGKGQVIGNAWADNRNSSGYVLSGSEYYTLFDGMTGAALDTVSYEFPRGNVSDWGDKYGNRVDRFLGAVAYLDGVHPSAVSVRGYYTRMTAVAYDVVNKKLVKRWTHDSGSNAYDGYGNGNHNCMPADVDGDGRQEIVLGSTCIDDNGKTLWCNNKGHGDAMHLGDFLPDRNGLELWVCHEASPYGLSLIDAGNGNTIFHRDGSKDTGRCGADNVYAGNRGAEFWGASESTVFNGQGQSIGTQRPGQNFFVYWDGDAEREILDGITVSKYVSPTNIKTIFTANGCTSINGTKAVPSLCADIIGDWREEIIFPLENSSALRVFTTTSSTDIRLTTLMHDPQYRVQAAGEQNCYNQPAHPSFYLGSDADLPSRPSVVINGMQTQGGATPGSSGSSGSGGQNTASFDPNTEYTIKNVNSGKYLDVDSSGSNAAQSGWIDNDGSTSWKIVSDNDGYYYLYSQYGDKSQVLDIAGKKTADGTNAGIYRLTGGDNQKFDLSPNGDGSYKICTKITGCASCIEVAYGSSDDGANVQQYQINGYNCQDWIIEPLYQKTPEITTTVTTQPETTVSETVNSIVTTVSETVNSIVTSVSETSQYSGAEIIYGDVNGDGVADLTDLTLISIYLMTGSGIDQSKRSAADVDGNGQIDIADLARFKQYVSHDSAVSKLGPKN